MHHVVLKFELVLFAIDVIILLTLELFDFQVVVIYPRYCFCITLYSFFACLRLTNGTEPADVDFVRSYCFPGVLLFQKACLFSLGLPGVTLSYFVALPDIAYRLKFCLFGDNKIVERLYWVLHSLCA